MLLRAGDWYQMARQMIQPGLVQVKLDKRLAEIARTGEACASQPTSSAASSPSLDDLIVHSGRPHRSEDGGKDRMERRADQKGETQEQRREIQQSPSRRTEQDPLEQPPG